MLALLRSSGPELALLFRRDAARLGPEVRVELPMAGAGALTFRNGGQTVRDRYAAQMTILTLTGPNAGYQTITQSLEVK